MSTDHVSEYAGFRKRVLAKLSTYGLMRSLFSRFRSQYVWSFLTPSPTSPNYSESSPGSVDRETERTDRREHRSMEDGVIAPDVPLVHESEFGRVDPTGWYPHYKQCVQYFLQCSQHTPAVQSIAAFINIRLPDQRPDEASSDPRAASSFISLRPYVRRLIITAQDSPIAMRAFFGDDWEAGVGCIYKQERINYLFTAKSSGWASTKAAYDILPDEQTPFLRPLREPCEEEIRAAEARWSEWLAMEDWMVGARSPW
ncbi:hypothetical protein N7492_007674 [Penicillium capsulatum]|uniref:Uncharacterized protein n=1 Tax=Penicillium capsulatum TaxID=69766 RepID=A0A9W9I2W1_9EURO|nr:hypothetical protein N7492_007674 [Penicillium capsulatum]KAJ6117508.1 hypothetical protein N7512_007233 [Penicillium capsulatum]